MAWPAERSGPIARVKVAGTESPGIREAMVPTTENPAVKSEFKEAAAGCYPLISNASIRTA